MQRDIMIISDVLPVMVDDALLSSHPIIVNVSSPAEITSVFDSISYSKVRPQRGSIWIWIFLLLIACCDAVFRERLSSECLRTGWAKMRSEPAAG